MSFLRVSFITAAIAAAFGASAHSGVRQEVLDSLIADHRLMLFGPGELSPAQDSVRVLVENFYYDQFRNFQDPAAPYFLFMSRDANLAMGIGGHLKMKAAYDWAGSVSSMSLSPCDIPLHSDPLTRSRLATDPGGTALFYRVIGRGSDLGLYQLYIEAGFSRNRDFHLKKAYATLGDWTVGLAPSTFGDAAAEPPAIDGGAPGMDMSASSVLVRWMHTFSSDPHGKLQWTIAASAETPRMSAQPQRGVTAARTQFLPDFAAFVQYAWTRSDHVRLAAITRFLPYRDLVAERDNMPVGWGAQLSGVATVCRELSLFGVVNGGMAYSNFGGDCLLGRFDLMASSSDPGRLDRVPGIGFYGGVRYDFSHSLFASCSFGQGICLKDFASADYRSGTIATASLFRSLSPRVRYGFELCLSRRQDFSGASRWARRAEAMVQFSF